MDKPTLTADQLQLVKDFIYSRGFRDELIVNEILDHFACKVEEELMKNPKATLSEAMYDAHRSFGVLGFYVIQANFEKNTRSRYRKLYWKSVKSVFTSLPFILAALLIWLFIFKSYYWANINNYKHIFGYNDILTLIRVVALGSLIYMVIRFRSKNNYYYSAARRVSWWWPTLWFIMITSNEPHSPRGILFSSVFLAIVTVIWFMLTIAEYRLLKAASVDYDEFKKIAE